MSASAVVTSYINPDLDGVACALVIASMEPNQWNARVFGAIDDETRVVLNALRMIAPCPVHSWADVSDIWLIDTHHPNQLPADLPRLRVSRITDHHTGGDPTRFPNAQIQNEHVGAAATLIAERYQAQGSALSRDLAVLLQCAIVSNTLDFLAAATTQRDRDAAKGLSTIQPMAGDLRIGMREARRGLLQLETALLVKRDTKTFATTRGIVIVGQIEAPGAIGLLSRTDLVSALRDLAHNAGAAAAVLNVVDTALSRSALVSTDVAVEDLLATGLGVSSSRPGIIEVDRVLQRKTDIVPFLIVAR